MKVSSKGLFDEDQKIPKSLEAFFKTPPRSFPNRDWFLLDGNGTTVQVSGKRKVEPLGVPVSQGGLNSNFACGVGAEGTSTVPSGGDRLAWQDPIEVIPPGVFHDSETEGWLRS